MIYLWFTLNYPTWSIRGWGTWAPASTLRGDRDIVWSTSGQVTWQNLVKPNTSFNWNWRGQTPCPPYANIGPPSPTASPNSWWGKAAPPAVTRRPPTLLPTCAAPGSSPWPGLPCSPAPPGPPPWAPAPGNQPGWQQAASLACDQAQFEALLPTYPAHERALLLSQAGPHAAVSLHDGPHKPRIHPRQPPFPHPAATAAAPPPRPRPGPMQLRRRPWPARRSPAACPPDTSVFARPRWNAP